MSAWDARRCWRGFWGEDIEGAELAGILKAANIDTAAVVTTRLPTTSKTRIVGRGQQLMRLDVESNDLPADAEQELRRCVLPLIPQVQAVILSDYAKGALTVELCEAVIRVARAAGVPVLADPKTPNLGKYSGATAVCPNLHELSIATGVTVYEFDALLRSAEKQRVEHELKHLCITMSEKGICVLSDAGKYNSQSRAREVFDVSGAGDTVIATLAAALAGGLRMETAVDLANLAAGIVVGKVGDGSHRVP